MIVASRSVAALTIVVAALIPPPTVSAQLPAFPGAQGFGAAATGGRGGEVFHVVNTLNTNAGTYEGPDGYNRGTLRWALLSEASSLPRTIVFDVSGTVALTSQITFENSNMTVAGQTAPGQGLSTSGRPWLFESGNNLVIRHVRNRLGRNGGQDSMGVEGGTNIIFDHVTSTWSNDEALSVAKDGTLVTVQHSFIYEGLNHSGHGYGSLIRPDIDSKVSYHHNLYANNESRNPRPGTYNSRTLDFDFRNNVVYNWGDRAGYSGGSSEGNPEHVNMNFVGNYVIAGPSTINNFNSAFLTDNNADLRAYQADNLIDSDRDSVRDGVDTGWGMFEVEAGTLTQVASPHPLAAIPVTTSTAADAYDDVLDHAGSFWWNRDSADARIADQVRTQTGTIIDHESEVGGVPALPALTRAADWDVDHDGMPGQWEVAHGLNPNSSPDRNGDFDNDGYTNLEEYINEVGAWPAPRAIGFSGGVGRYALNGNWDAWQPSRFDVVEINAGVATVDAVGQHAGTLKIASTNANSAQLNISGGRLEVANEVIIGGAPAAQGVLNLSGGELRTPKLSKSDAGEFNFTGGVLRTSAVEFGLTNKGGTFAPGASPATTTIMGDLTLNDGVLEIEIGKLGGGVLYDRLEVDGKITFGGTLRVKLVDLGEGVYEPQAFDSFGVFFPTSGQTEGEFDAFDLPPLAPGLEWALLPGDVTVFLGVVPTAGNPADFNGDARVDGQDLAAWTSHFGTPLNATHAQGDADLDGDVNGRDFLEWQRQHGAGAPTALSVPEPAAWLLTSIVAAAGGRRRSSRGAR